MLTDRQNWEYWKGVPAHKKKGCCVGFWPLVKLTLRGLTQDNKDEKIMQILRYKTWFIQFLYILVRLYAWVNGTAFWLEQL